MTMKPVILDSTTYSIDNNSRSARNVLISKFLRKTNLLARIDLSNSFKCCKICYLSSEGKENRGNKIRNYRRSRDTKDHYNSHQGKNQSKMVK